MSQVDILLDRSSSNMKVKNDKSKDKNELGIHFENEFAINFTNLNEDIQKIDARLAHLQKFIVNMETQVNNLRALIANDNNPAKRGSYYTLMNTCVELNARYEDLYLRCLDIKFKYRKEQDDLSHKVKKISNLDMPRMLKEVDDSRGELSASKLASLLTMLSNQISSTEKEANGIRQTLSDLDNDPDLRI